MNFIVMINGEQYLAKDELTHFFEYNDLDWGNLCNICVRDMETGSEATINIRLDDMDMVLFPVCRIEVSTNNPAVGVILDYDTGEEKDNNV